MNLKQSIQFCDEHADYYRTNQGNEMDKCIAGLQILRKYCESGYIDIGYDTLRAGDIDGESNYNEEDVEALYRLGWYVEDEDKEYWEFNLLFH